MRIEFCRGCHPRCDRSQRIEAELIVARDAAEAMRNLADLARDSADRANQAKSRFWPRPATICGSPSKTLALLNGTLRRIVTYSNAADALLQQNRRSTPCRATAECLARHHASSNRGPSSLSRAISPSPPFSKSCAWSLGASRRTREFDSTSRHVRMPCTAMLPWWSRF